MTGADEDRPVPKSDAEAPTDRLRGRLPGSLVGRRLRPLGGESTHRDVDADENDESGRGEGAADGEYHRPPRGVGGLRADDLSGCEPGGRARREHAQCSPAALGREQATDQRRPGDEDGTDARASDEPCRDQQPEITSPRGEPPGERHRHDDCPRGDDDPQVARAVDDDTHAEVRDRPGPEHRADEPYGRGLRHAQPIGHPREDACGDDEVHVDRGGHHPRAEKVRCSRPVVVGPTHRCTVIARDGN